MKAICRIGVWTLLLVVFLSSYASPGQAAAKEFQDVPKSHPNYEAIQYMQMKGYMSGYDDNLFRPGEQISRKHVAKLLDRVLKLPNSSNAKVKYLDVPKSHPYYSSIMKVSTAGIFSGDVDGNFHPEAPITRIQMAKVLDMAFNLNMTSQNAFFDVYMDHWGYTHANALFSSGVAKGYEGEFYPDSFVTRAHYAEFLYRAIRVKEQQPNTDEITKDRSWNLANRLPILMERVMREGVANSQSFDEVRVKLQAFATKEFMDSELKENYPYACQDCYSYLFPYLRFEPLVRFEYIQPDANTLIVQTVEFQSGVSPGGFIEFRFEKQSGKWKMADYTFTPAGTEHLQLTVDEAKTIIQEEHLRLGYKKVVIKYVTSTDQVELDPVTDEPYHFDQYTFNAETEYGRFKVKFNSSDGMMY